MGTDIGLYAERRQGAGWVPVPEPCVRPWSNGEAVPVEPFDIGRPYALFSVLAGCGIGLSSRMSKIPYISQPRGLPPDLSPALWKHFGGGNPTVDDDWTGASWLLVRELSDFDWNQPVEQVAFVEAKYAGLFSNAIGFPERFPKDAKLYHGLFQPPPEGTRKVHWSTPLRQYVGCADEFLRLL